MNLWLYVLCGLVLLFLVAPSLIVIPMSFSSANSLAFPPPGWSLRWYQSFLGEAKWLQAAWVSLRVAFGAMVLAVPRTRGDEPPMVAMLVMLKICSPHPRG